MVFLNAISCSQNKILANKKRIESLAIVEWAAGGNCRFFKEKFKNLQCQPICTWHSVSLCLPITCQSMTLTYCLKTSVAHTD